MGYYHIYLLRCLLRVFDFDCAVCIHAVYIKFILRYIHCFHEKNELCLIIYILEKLNNLNKNFR